MTAGTLNLMDTKEVTVIDYSAAMVDELISQWIVECDVAAGTQKSYRTAIKSLVGYLRSNNVTLSENVLISYREWLKSKKETSTAKLFFGRAKKFTAWLAKRGYIACNYADGLKGVALDTTVHSKDALTVDEVIDTLQTFSTAKKEIELRNKAIMYLLINCGLRSCEVIRADVGDIEKRRGVWTMKIWGKGRSGKNDSIVLPEEVKEIIDEYLKVRGKVKANEPLFTSTSRRNYGQRIQTQNISRLAKRTFKAAGIDSKRITCHSTRHTNATIALDFGVSLDDVSKNLRHRSTAVTEIYRHDEKTFTNQTNRKVAAIIFGKLKEAALNG